MKKILLTSCIVLMCGNAAGLPYCTDKTCPTSDDGTKVTGSTTRCDKYTRTCYRGNGSGVTQVLYSCDTCKTGYKIRQMIDTSFECGNVSYYYCDCPDTCKTITWTSVSTGYEKFIDCGTSTNCVSTTTYRCAAGYYGSSTDGKSGCTRCPIWSGVYADAARTTTVYGTSRANANAAYMCFVPSGTYYDATGTFTLSSNCSYRT